MFFKYALLLTNQKKFASHKFQQERIQRLSETRWFALNSENRNDNVFQMQRTELEFDDNYFNVAGLFTHFDSGFQYLQMPMRTLPYTNYMQNAVTFEMNLTKKMYYRSVYSSLDFISDIGGLFGALMPLFTAILTIFNFSKRSF